jgi:NitT/TauT family transport system substrate-binding protein
MLKSLLVVVFVFSLIGCSQETKVNPAETQVASKEVKKKPDKVAEIKMGLPSKMNMSYIPIYVAQKKGYYKKYNLDVKLTIVQGGVLALRGLQNGDF